VRRPAPSRAASLLRLFICLAISLRYPNSWTGPWMKSSPTTKR